MDRTTVLLSRQRGKELWLPICGNANSMIFPTWLAIWLQSTLLRNLSLVLPMDFQLARNLSALSRAQHEISDALLHIDCLSDLLNREIIMSASCSEATEQLVVTARALLTQVHMTLETQSNEGARRLRESQINFIASRRNRSSSTSSSDDSVHAEQDTDQHDQAVSDTHSVATVRLPPSEGHSFAETAIRGCLWRDETSD